MSKKTVTTNGMGALSTSSNALVDYFYGAGALRGRPNELIDLFDKAYRADKLLATKLMFWTRDVRGGAGERESFRALIDWMTSRAPETLAKNLHLIPKYGRWDDLLTIKKGNLRKLAFSLIATTLRNQTEGWQLCSKWMPRKGADAVALRNFMNLSPKAYRKMLVNGTNVVESAMCSGDWENINFETVPSVASKIYQRAFNRHSANYALYKEALATGDAKINASAIFPHDVLKGSDRKIVNAQWNALPNYLEGADGNILPMIDISGSMCCPVGGAKNVTCFDISTALGLYLAERQEGPFKDVYLTFSREAHIEKVSGKDVIERYRHVQHYRAGYNTNLENAFNQVLKLAKKHNVKNEDMPKMIVIFSDMQFDAAVSQGQVEDVSPRAMQMIEKQYADFGYTVPKIVYWNLNGASNTPVGYSKSGAALVSGFSPAILKAVLSSKLDDFTPYSVMLEAINSDRYEEVTV